jgi:aryl-alcohol dehydrogenase-like predicted oxidoreductase
MEPILAAVNELYKAGKFKRFGISNFRADEVEKVIRIGKQNNYILPSVYQGNYSAVARLTEKELFPTLRKYNIAFYAYSPIAGGFLTKSPKQLMDGGQGRWDPSNFLGQLYGTLYKKPAMLKALEMWGEIAKDLGISKAELAYRWVAFNSHIEGELGDAIIIGARTIEQLKETLAGLRNGPLSEDAVGKIDELWKTIEHVSPLDNYNNYISLQQELAVMK